MFLHRLGRVRAPEFPAALTWLNSKSLSLRDLRGKVVLVEFWTYSCVNCLRVLPHVERWHQAYRDKGLVVIGVHTPEFAFEKDEQHVARAMQDSGVSYPVVLDSDYVTWKLYANNCWPHRYLINREGYIVYDHAGEGAYASTELAIQEALKETGVRDFPAIGPDDSVAGSVCYRTTPETYLGFLRGHMGNAQEIFPDTEEAFTDKEEVHEEGIPYVHGHWKVAGEYVEHTRQTSGMHEYVRLRYQAFSVNLVMATAHGKTATIEISCNGQPLNSDMRGEDILEEKGKTVVIVREPRMYRLINSRAYHHGDIKIGIADAGVQLYAFTFGGCEE